jgi:hypothetical protein
MRKTLTTAALLLALSCPAWGGIIHTPGVSEPEPEPTPTSTAQESATTSEDTTGATDTLTQMMLTVLISVLP